jgi:hypothetical protein
MMCLCWKTQNGAKTMGMFVDPRAGEAPPCDGEDILGQLNHVFGYSYWKMYQYAREHNKFGAIKNAPGNYKALIEAYEYAGLEVTPRWAAYLRVLGTISSPDPEQGPQNIYDIAQYRDRNLKSNLGMRTTIHEPHDGGHVHVLPGTGIDPEVVDSPFPLPE